MTVLAAGIVDWGALGKVIGASFVAGVGVTIAFSLAIAGAVRFSDMRRDERMVEAALYAVLGVVGLAVTLAALVAGIVLMTSK